MTRLSEIYHSLVRRTGLKRVFAYGLLGLSVVLLGLGLYALVASPTSHDYTLRITAGSSLETRDNLVSYLKRKAPDVGIELEPQVVTGSVEALDKVHRGLLDLAFVQGALRIPEDTRVRQAAAVLVEPLHVLVKREIHEDVCADLGALAGRSINVGPAGGETRILATRVLEFIGLRPGEAGRDRGGYEPATISDRELFEILDAMEAGDEATRASLRQGLPDAIFLITALPSRAAGGLVRLADYALVPLQFGRAFSLIGVEEEARDSDRIDQIHVITTEIPPFTYGVIPPVPPAAHETLGSYLILVANEDVPADAVARLLPLLYEGPIQHLYDPPPPDERLTAYPLHEGTLLFEDRNKPLLRSELFQLLQKILSIFGPLVGAGIALYGFFRWRQVLRFSHYFEEILRLELVAQGHPARTDDVPEDPPGRLRYVQGELDKVQRQAVADFCGNYLRGEGVLMNLLTLIDEAQRRIQTECEGLRPPSDPADPAEAAVDRAFTEGDATETGAERAPDA